MKARQKKKVERRGPTLEEMQRELASLRLSVKSMKAEHRQQPVIQLVEEKTPAELPPATAVPWFDDRFYRITEENRTVFYPSVTTILSSAYPHVELERWRATVGIREAQSLMRVAAERGTIIHNAAHVYATGGLVVYQAGKRRTHQELAAMAEYVDQNISILYDQEHMLQAERFARWLDALKAEVRGSELTVYSHGYGIAGTLDLLLELEAGSYMVNGSSPLRIPETGLYVVDLKTGNGIWDSHKLQVAAYSMMCEDDENGISESFSISGAIVLHTNADTRAGIPGVATHLRTRQDIESDWATFQHALALWHAAAEAKPKIFELPSLLRRQV